MKKINFIIIIWVLFYAFVFCFLLSNSYGYLDPDLGWHLKVGEQIINEKAVPSYEYYNWTLEGKKWVDHEWLINIIIYLIYNNFGYLAVNAFFALIILATLIILNIFTQKYFLKEKNGQFFILLFQALGLIAMAPHLGVRMQEITVLNLLLLLIIIYNYEKNKNYKILFWLLPLFYFWACLHAGFLIGIFIMFFWLSVKIIEIIIAKYKITEFIGLENKLNFKNIRTFFCFAFFSVIITFFTPYGIKLYKFLGGYGNTFYMTHIQEWLPIFYFPFQYRQLLYIAFVTAAIYIIIYNREKTKLKLWEISILLVFIILAFKSKRHFPLLFIISFPIIIKFFVDLFNFKEIFKKIPCRLLFIKTFLIVGFLIIIASQIIKINFTPDPFLSFNGNYPQEAMIFLKNNPQYNNLKFFNSYAWGGYLIWTLPNKKLFIDGRLPQYEFAGHTFLEEYCEFFDKEKIEKKLNEYDIKLVLLNIKEKRYKLNQFEKYFLGLDEGKINKSANENHLKDYLNNSSEWKKIYTDKISAVYVKK